MFCTRGSLIIIIIIFTERHTSSWECVRFLNGFILCCRKTSPWSFFAALFMITFTKASDRMISVTIGVRLPPGLVQSQPWFFSGHGLSVKSNKDGISTCIVHIFYELCNCCFFFFFLEGVGWWVHNSVSYIRIFVRVLILYMLYL